jgi:hypothetical protein
MLVYWSMFLLPAWASFFRERNSRVAVLFIWGSTWLALTLLIGYRHEVGGDWFNYLIELEENDYLSFWEALARFDPAHGALNWLSNYMGWGVYGVNLVYGAIFSLGLITFCRHQPRPLLALAVAMPYLVIVVAMGYSRQGVAIGVALPAILALAERNTVKFVILVAIAGLFHKTAVVLVPIAALSSTRSKIWTATWVGATAVLMYVLYLQDAAEALIQNYIETEYSSEGGAIRVAMNVVPAVLFLLNRKRFHLVRAEQALWTWIALFALTLVPALIFSPSSTAVDRAALYFIPIQIFVLSRLPGALWRGRHRRVVQGGVILYYGSALFVWLNYSTYAYTWLPYQFYPLIET